VCRERTPGRGTGAARLRAAGVCPEPQLLLRRPWAHWRHAHAQTVGR
jgi:hypothetical protein